MVVPDKVVEAVAAAYGLHRGDRGNPVVAVVVYLAGGMTEEDITAGYVAAGLVEGPGGTPADLVSALCDIVRRLPNRNREEEEE